MAASGNGCQKGIHWVALKGLSAHSARTDHCLCQVRCHCFLLWNSCVLPSWLLLPELAKQQALCPKDNAMRKSSSLDVVYHYFGSTFIYSNVSTAVFRQLILVCFRRRLFDKVRMAFLTLAVELCGGLTPAGLSGCAWRLR